MVAEKKFKLEVDNLRNYFIIKVWGFFTADDANDFIQSYQEAIKTFNPNDYTLVVDGRDLKTSSPDVAAMLQKVMQMYIQTPFKKRYSIELNSLLTKMQLQRLGQDVIFQYFTFVNSESEIQ